MANDELRNLLTKNYFQLFGLAYDFTLDSAKLTTKYHNLQKQFHPDNFITYSKETQALALQLSAQINSAYRVLNSPLERALFLLKLHNQELNLAQNTLLPQQFLIEQMEIHEEVDLAKANHNIDLLEKIISQLRLKEQDIHKQIAIAFKNNQLNILSELVKQLSFYTKLIAQIKQVINQLW